MKLNKTNKKIISLLFTALMIILIFTVFVMPIIAGSNKVDISIQPPTKNIIVNETFTLDIRVEAGNQSVTGIQVFLDFDPRYLEVVSITPGTTLPMVLVREFNNTVGTIGYAAGDLEKPFPNGTFTLATINFRALRETITTRIEFSQTFPRNTMADFGGTDVTGNIISASVKIIIPTLKDIRIYDATIVVGKTHTFEAVPVPEGVAIGNITWRVEDETIGTIDPVTGVFTATSVNETTITATYRNFEKTATVTVVEVELPADPPVEPAPRIIGFGIIATMFGMLGAVLILLKKKN